MRPVGLRTLITYSHPPDISFGDLGATGPILAGSSLGPFCTQGIVLKLVGLDDDSPGEGPQGGDGGSGR